MASLVDPDDAGRTAHEHRDPLTAQASPSGRGIRRAELVANAGHELKTPLSIIIGLAGRLLAAAPEASPQRRDLERVRANAYGLLKQVDDLLQAARFDDGRVVVDPVDCDVAALVRDAATAFQTLLDERGQRLVLRTPGRLAARTDEPKLLTILTNLLA